MMEGKLLWDKQIVEDIYEKRLSNGTVIETYTGLPDNLYESLKRTAHCFPEHLAITDNYGRDYTYQEFLEKCDELSAYLNAERNVCQGSHVGLLMYNCFEFCVAFFALLHLGAVTVPLPSKFKRAEVTSLVERAEISLIICDENYEEWFSDSILSESMIVVKNLEKEYGYQSVYADWPEKARVIQREEIKMKTSGDIEATAIIMFTSGTTSMSKGVVLKNYNVMHAVETYKRILHITEKDISVIGTPIYHVTGLVALLGVFVHVGGHLYLNKFFDAERIVLEAEKYGYTFIHASPTVFNLILQEKENIPELPQLRSFACGSSNMPKEKLLQLHRWLPDSVFHTVYGLTETSSPATIFPADAAMSKRIGSSGRPIPGIRLKIVDEDNKEVPSGTVGEVLVSGTVVLEHYYKLETESLKDGWLHTGDLGYMTEDSYLYIVDRKKDMINRGGEKIWCYDVENELMGIEGVEDAAVVGIPDELYGEVAAALISLKKGYGLTQEKIQQLLRKKIAKYKVPVKIKAVDQIPQTMNGKIDKKEVRKILMEEES